MNVLGWGRLMVCFASLFLLYVPEADSITISIDQITITVDYTAAKAHLGPAHIGRAKF